MAVFRIEKTKDYTIMSNHHLRNKDLSLKAKGLQSLMLSLPDNWDYTLAGLAVICQDGISSVRSGIAELEEHGYLTRQRKREANGQLSDIEYTIHEIPVDNSVPACEDPTSEKPMCENQTLDNPIYGNRTELSNTSNQEPKELNTYVSNIHQSITTDADKTEIYRTILKNNIEYDYLCETHRNNRDEIEELLELMVDTVCSAKPTVRVNGEDKPKEIVKSRFMKIDQFHIEYILEQLNVNTGGVRNIKSYLLTTLYNAPATMENYYKQMVQHDLYGSNRSNA